MLKLFGNTPSKQLEKNKNLDFTELYKKISEVHDFFDVEHSKLGNLKWVGKELSNKFKWSEIYKDSFIKLEIKEIFVKDEKIRAVLSFSTDIEYEYMLKFWRGYSEEYFDIEDWFYATTSRLNVVEVKGEIEKRWDLLRVSTQFQENEYEFQEARFMQEGQYLYKELEVTPSSILISFSDKKREAYYEKLKYYFEFLRNLLDKDYEIETLSKNSFSVTDMDWEKFNVLISAKDNIIGARLYFSIINTSFEKAEEIHEMLEKNINHINEVLEEREEISKIVKWAKRSLWSALQPDYISKNVGLLMREYHKLHEKWDSFGEVASDLMLSIKLDISDIGLPVVDYDVTTYNKLLDSLLKEDYKVMVDYYTRKLIRLSKTEDRGLISQTLASLIKIPDSERVNALNDIDNLDEILTREDIEMIMDSISEDYKAVFINQTYVKFLRKDIETTTTNLEIYKDIHKYPVMDHVIDRFYDLLVKSIVFTYLNIESRDIVLKPLWEALEELAMSVYVDDVEAFEEKHKDTMYYEFYKELIQRDCIFIDHLNDKSFAAYQKLDEENIDNFIENILVSHILWVFHKMDRQEVTKHIKLLEGGFMIEVLDELGYPEIIKDIVFQSDNEKDYCREILYYWGILEELPELETYNRSSIDTYIKEKQEWMLQEKLDAEIDSSLWATKRSSSLTLEDKIDEFINLLLEKGNKELQLWLIDLGENLILYMLNYASIDAKKNMAKVQGLPDDVYIKLAEDQDNNVVFALINWQDSLGSEIGDILANHRSKKIISSFVNRFKLSEETQRKIWTNEEGMLKLLNNQKILKWWVAQEMAKYGSDKVKKRLLNYSSKLDKETQKILIKDKNEDIAIQLLSNQKTICKKSAKWIVNNGSDRIKKKFIERYKLSWDIQKKLAKDSENIVLYMLDKQSKLRDGSWYLVVEHPSLKVKRRLAEWNLGEEISLKLAKEEEDEKLLLNLLSSGKKEYHKNVLLELAKKDSEKVWLKILEGFETMDMPVLAQLTNHPSLKVRRRLMKWNLSEEIFLKIVKKETDEELLLNIIAPWRKKYYSSVLLELAKKDSEEIGRRLVEWFSTMDSSVFFELVNHPSLKVRKRLSKWKLNEDISLKLAKKEKNEELLLNLLKWREKYSNKLLLELIKKDSEKIWLYIIDNFKSLDSSICYKLAKHPSKKVQKAVAKKFNL